MTSEFLAWLNKLIRDGNVQPFYTSAEWRHSRAKALKHYHGECQRCKSKTPSVLTAATMVHHVKPVKRYPQYALDMFVFNPQSGEYEPQLIPLCHDCHAAVESKVAALQEQYPERW